MNRSMLFLTPLVFFTMTGCAASEPELSAKDLVKLGCEDYQSDKGLRYFEQAADLDSQYRALSQSVNAIQINLILIKSDKLGSDFKKSLALKSLADLAVINSFC